MLLHTHKDSTDNINLLEIAKEFVSFNDRRINFLNFLLLTNAILPFAHTLAEVLHRINTNPLPVSNHLCIMYYLIFVI